MIVAKKGTKRKPTKQKEKKQKGGLRKINLIPTPPWGKGRGSPLHPSILCSRLIISKPNERPTIPIEDQIPTTQKRPKQK
ncbi:hypothetical protein BC832DRAFT_397702 [Gaertneriomyces semiglobifer]|nr:hypothetical protein BC832DRAFT_397702 [Gaertneriomyces semiglobifer]